LDDIAHRLWGEKRKKHPRVNSRAWTKP
jgi:hypothetical protein